MGLLLALITPKTTKNEKRCKKVLDQVNFTAIEHKYMLYREIQFKKGDQSLNREKKLAKSIVPIIVTMCMTGF